MKIIVSHDVDHINVTDHLTDTTIPKFLVRGIIELITGYISSREYLRRLTDIRKNKWQNIREIMFFDKKHCVPSTFFIGMAHGKGMNYSLRKAALWSRIIESEGFDAGVHGIAFDHPAGVKREFEKFAKITKSQVFGIRTHYLRCNHESLRLFNEAGYQFDSSIYQLIDPYKVGDLWEFPISVMDGSLFYKSIPWQNKNLEEAQDATIMLIEKALSNNLQYFSLLFHDRYFSDAFASWRDWYVWVIEYFRKRDFQFVSYRNAIQELS